MANALRALAMDAVQQANSGHPGAPMGMAEIAVALWGRHLRHNPGNPHWVDRDRFVLSNGHGSMLLYALLHLTGYDLAVSELRNFRQLHSKTPGHPEHGLTPGVETTTGPLGQGLANAVGMALAEKLLAHEFNRPGHAIVDHHTYVFLGDGCLMEGISHEACALAGVWRLHKLIAFYDDNGISIDGAGHAVVHRRHAETFRGLRLERDRGRPTDTMSKRSTPRSSRPSNRDRPTLIDCKTIIGKGSPNRAGTGKAHGEPLGADEVQLTRARLGWQHEPFVVPEAAYEGWDAPCARRRARSGVGVALHAVQGGTPGARRRVRAARERRVAARLCATRGRRARRRAREGRERRHAQGEPARARSLHEGAARDDRRQRRPDRIEPHATPAARRRCASTKTVGPTAAATSTTACASSAWPR